jgi:hypothetical protein
VLAARGSGPFYMRLVLKRIVRMGGEIALDSYVLFGAPTRIESKRKTRTLRTKRAKAFLLNTRE